MRRMIAVGSLLLLLAGAAIHCEKDNLGSAYVWRPGGLALRETPERNGKKLAAIAFGARIGIRNPADQGEPVRLDGVRSRWRAVRFENRDGFVLSGFLARLNPPAECASFANHLAELENNLDPIEDPLVEHRDIQLPVPGTTRAVKARKRRTTTLYENGIQVVDEESPRAASITIKIDNFPLVAAFHLARMCNPNFFQGIGYPRKNMKRTRGPKPAPPPPRNGDAEILETETETEELVSSIDRARFSGQGSPLLFENRTETSEHLERTTVQPVGQDGQVRIKYFYATLGVRSAPEETPDDRAF